jgi:hypothetical protein
MAPQTDDHNCNVGIGNLRHDPEIMMVAARYVAAHREAAVTAGQP